MKAGHERLVGLFFHGDGLNVHGAARGPYADAIEHQGDGQCRGGGRQNQQWQQQGDGGNSAYQHLLAAESTGADTGDRHTDQGAASQAEQHQSHGAVTELHIELDEGNARRPGGGGKPRAEEGGSRGQPVDVRQLHGQCGQHGDS
ncbi:hypothetical protein D3C80_1270550 [compost metagenome]